MKRLFALCVVLVYIQISYSQVKYPVVDTGQKDCFSNNSKIEPPKPGEAFYGQDACIQGNQPKYKDNGDGTITDYATGLMWQKTDDGNLYDWKQALAYADTLSLAGYSDWYLPNAKELESIVDYSRAPSVTDSPAISPLFECSKHELYDGVDGYAYYWSSTTHLDGPNPYKNAVYVCFGEAWGREPRTNEFCDVHGAGAQRSDPKSGSSSEYPRFFGPQKDMLCVFNAVRCVRKIK